MKKEKTGETESFSPYQEKILHTAYLLDMATGIDHHSSHLTQRLPIVTKQEEKNERPYKR